MCVSKRRNFFLVIFMIFFLCALNISVGFRDLKGLKRELKASSPPTVTTSCVSRIPSWDQFLVVIVTRRSIVPHRNTSRSRTQFVNSLTNDRVLNDDDYRNLPYVLYPDNLDDVSKVRDVLGTLLWFLGRRMYVGRDGVWREKEVTLSFLPIVSVPSFVAYFFATESLRGEPRNDITHRDANTCEIGTLAIIPVDP